MREGIDRGHCTVVMYVVLNITAKPPRLPPSPASNNNVGESAGCFFSSSSRDVRLQDPTWDRAHLFREAATAFPLRA